MGHVFYLLLRRLRAPIILIIVVYAISILGFVLIPGIDDEGNPWRMDFFHAFYFVSYMGTTIGFGELPYPFTTPQRVWATITIYATVISWLYSIGKIFALLQDPSLNRMLARNNFAREVNMISEPFYLVCGYGVTGQRLVQRLDEHGTRTVVVDCDPAVIDLLEAHELGLAVPGLCGDAADPEVLNRAGIRSGRCIGVVALTDHDHTNLCVSINSKLVDPDRPVYSRSQSDETTANLASFGTDHIIDPFATYAEYLVKSIVQPYKHIISDLVFNPHHKVWASPHQDTEGRWVVCGYGRLGRAIEASFGRHDIPITFIESDPEMRDVPRGTVRGVGTEAATLHQADIDSAIGIVAGTADDADNLSIIITSKDIKSKIITVARQNLAANKPVFRAAHVNMIMEPTRIIADETFIRIMNPLLMEFLDLMAEEDGEWARELLLKISDTVEEQPLTAWTHEISAKDSPAIHYSLTHDMPVEIGYLCRDPRQRDERMPCFALLLKRDGKCTLLPDGRTQLAIGDQVLFCGQEHARPNMGWITHNANVLRYIRTGMEAPGGLLWRWLEARRVRAKAPGEAT